MPSFLLQTDSHEMVGFLRVSGSDSLGAGQPEREASLTGVPGQPKLFDGAMTLLVHEFRGKRAKLRRVDASGEVGGGADPVGEARARTRAATATASREWRAELASDVGLHLRLGAGDAGTWRFEGPRAPAAEGGCLLVRDK